MSFCTFQKHWTRTKHISSLFIAMLSNFFSMQVLENNVVLPVNYWFGQF